MEKMSFAAFKSAALEKLVVLKSLLTLGWGMAVKKATEARPEDVEKARAAAEATKEKATKIKSKLDGKVPPIVWKVAGIVIVVLCAWFLLDALLLFAVLFVAYVLIGLFLQGKNRPLPASADKIVLPSILILSLVVGLYVGRMSGGAFVEASDISFANIFQHSVSPEFGTAFRHRDHPAVQVLSVTDEGVLVHYVYGSGNYLENMLEQEAERVSMISGGGSNDKIVFVETRDGGYVDGAQLKEGIYVRKGTYSYTTALGTGATVEAYAKITDKGEIERFEVELRKNQEARAVARKKAEKEAAEKAAKEKARLEREMAKYEAEMDKELAYLDKMEPLARMDEILNRLKEIARSSDYRQFTQQKAAAYHEYKNANKDELVEASLKFLRTYLIWKKYGK